MPRLQWKQLLGFNGVAVGIIGFILVGVVCLGSIAFGVYQTVTNSGDTGGSGQVLTVLGMYFSVPYLLVLGAFIYSTFEFKMMSQGATFWTSRTTLVVVIILYLVQQGFSDVYLVLLLGPVALVILLFDLLVLGMFIWWRLCPNTCVAYVVLFATKMGLVWGDAYKFANEPVFGPSGFATMLFVCIPIIQMTLFSPTVENEGISQAFVARFNIATTHLLHSLDIISFFAFCFRPLDGRGQYHATPGPLRWMMLFFAVIAFCANNLGVPLLFFRRSFRAIRLPQRATSLLTATQSTVSHRDFHALESMQQQGGGGGGMSHLTPSSAGDDGSGGGGGGGGGGGVVGGADSPSSVGYGGGGTSPLRGSGGEGIMVDNSSGGGGSHSHQPATGVNYNENEQMMTFMMLMLMLCDFPFLATRFALWSTKIDRMDVFAAKNIKAMFDVLMLLTKTQEVN